LAIVAVVLAVGASIVPAEAQTPPSVTTRYTSTFTGVNPPARHFNLLQGISEFQPGEAARNNSTPGPRFFTALEGELTVLIGDKTEVFGAGKTWSVPGGITLGVKNEGANRGRVFFSVLAPIGGPGGSPQPGSAVPAAPSRILQTVSTPVTVTSDNLNVIQVVQDWAPGARNSNHVMNQPHVYSMLEGENTTRYLDGSSERWTPGQAGVMTVGRGGYMENSGTAPARLFFTWVVVPGAPQTLPLPVPASPAAPSPAMPGFIPPRTGDAGLLGRSTLGLPVVILLSFTATMAGLAATRRRSGSLGTRLSRHLR